MSSVDTLKVSTNTNRLEEVRNIVRRVTLPEGLQWRVANHPEGRVFLQLYKETICNRTGGPYRDGGRKWDISNHATLSEIVCTTFKAALTFIEHEYREQFKFDGYAIFDPHTDVIALKEACQRKEERDEMPTL